LLQLWVMALRGVDDVKESVRAAAGGLLRGLRGLSLRIMDVAQTPAAGEGKMDSRVWMELFHQCM
jgi:hypothetical protein